MKIEIRARTIFRNFLIFVLLPVSVVCIAIFFLTMNAPVHTVGVIHVASQLGVGFVMIYPTVLLSCLVAAVIHALAEDKVYTLGSNKDIPIPKAKVNKL